MLGLMALRVPTIVYLCILLTASGIDSFLSDPGVLVSDLESGPCLVTMNSVRQWPASPYLNMALRARRRPTANY